MLPKWIERKEKNDNYRALALYIADASIGHLVQGEKTLLSWYTGGNAEDYLCGLIEVEATQALNTRTSKEKAYHLMISFRPEDEAKLTPEMFKDIEREFAQALGFEEHQRHCGVHKNTDNIHMHIAYNMIHSETFNRRDPYYHLQKIYRKAREREHKYGLAIDKGMEPRATESKPEKIGVKAKTMEAHSGQQSFQRYVDERREELMAALEGTADWSDLHQTLASYGLKIVPHGAGLVIKNQAGQQTLKASSLDRQWGKGMLEKRFGSYQNRTEKVSASVSEHSRLSGNKVIKNVSENMSKHSHLSGNNSVTKIASAVPGKSHYQPGKQSFEEHLYGNKTNFMAALEASASWPDLHQVLASYGLEIVAHGAGLVIKNRAGNKKH